MCVHTYMNVVHDIHVPQVDRVFIGTGRVDQVFVSTQKSQIDIDIIYTPL